VTAGGIIRGEVVSRPPLVEHLEAFDIVSVFDIAFDSGLAFDIQLA